MGIRAVYVRHYRSIASASLSPCTSFNVLIGKNNAGKSNLLAAIESILRHLREGSIARPLRSTRSIEEFTDRDHTQPIRIGIEFDLPSETNAELRARLTKESPHLDKSVEQIAVHKTVSFVLAGVIEGDTSFAFLEQMGVGTISGQGDTLEINGLKLLSVNKRVARELYENFISATRLGKDIEILENVHDGRQIPLQYLVDQPKENRLRLLLSYTRSEMTTDTIVELTSVLNPVTSQDELKNGIGHLIEEIKSRVERMEKQEIAGVLSAFAGDTKIPPAYAKWLMQKFGGLPTLHVRETKRPIGRDEAKTLLELKITRGGPKRFAAIQDTMRNLLGINLDAFQSEGNRESAEMDIDEFLVEANGAGIRGALRIVLDLELKSPELALVEEPEVHMHPGLARIVAAYLRERSDRTQVFMTTHSTDFIDFVPFQNIFLVSKDPGNHTSAELLAADEAVLRIPSELGLRLSSFFMFDRLVFVEGQSDEAVIRQLARNRNIELAKANIGFVYMKGVRNFAHYAAQATLEIISRRQIGIWFLVDRDENDDEEIKQMVTRLGDHARLVVLDCRELENHLLDPCAVTAFIEDKLKRAGIARPAPTLADVAAALQEEAVKLKDEAIRLRVEKKLLRPVFLHSRAFVGTIAERLKAGEEDLSGRLKSLETVQREIEASVDAEWPARARFIAPGTRILEAVTRRFGTTFSKEKGDSEHLARLLPTSSIPTQLLQLLEEISSAT